MASNPYQPPRADLTTAAGTSPGAPPALWNPNAVANWSFLFTPVFGAILVSKNWQALGDSQKASRARIWAYVSAPLIMAQLGLPLLIAWYYASNRPQARYVKEQWGQAYPRQPWGRPLGFAALAYLVLFGLAFTLIFAFASRSAGA